MCGGVDPNSLTLWEWQALTWNWNDRHSPDDEPGGGGARPDPDKVRAVMAARVAKVASAAPV